MVIRERGSLFGQVRGAVQMLRLVVENPLVHGKRDNAGQSGKLVLAKLVVCGNRGDLSEDRLTFCLIFRVDKADF